MPSLNRASSPAWVALAALSLSLGCSSSPKLSINPNTGQTKAGGAVLSFSATLTDSSDSIAWTIAPAVGSLSSASGSTTTYTPPATLAAATTVTLTATAGSVSATAAISVAPPDPTLSITPAAATVKAGGAAVPFTAALANSTSAITWTLAPAVGTLSATTGATINYTPPATTAAAATVTLTATAAGVTATATITVALGDGTVGQSATRATGSASTFSAPFDAALSPAGDKLYFTAYSGTDGAVYSQSGTAAAAQISTGGVLVSPLGLGVSTDGNTLYVADSGALAGTGDAGGVFSLSAGGGTPAVVSGTEGYAPTSLAVARQAGIDVIYFSGTGTNGAAGVFKVPAAGGTSTLVATGLDSPSGVTVDAAGNAYFIDGPAGNARLLKAAPGNTATTLVLGNLAAGWPAAAALVQDESAILVAAKDATGKDALLRVPLAAPAATALPATVAFADPGGLHRASGADLYAFADSDAGGSGTVSVFSK